MSIEFSCSQCNQMLRVADETAGKKARCPQCGNIQSIPQPGDTTGAFPDAGAESAIGGTSRDPYSRGDDPFGATPDPFARPAASENPFSDTAGLDSPFGSPSTKGENPFTVESQNPYQAPAAAMGSGSIPTRSREDIQAQVTGPAVGMMIYAGLGLAMSLFSLVMQGIVLIEAQGPGPEALIPQVIGMSISVGMYGLVLAGAWKMRSLTNYGLSLAAAIICVIPCGGCCIIGMPIGIWAIVVLADHQVKGAFS